MTSAGVPSRAQRKKEMKKNKLKKKGKMLFEEESPIPSEPAPEREIDLSWTCFASSKKDNQGKRKGKNLTEEEDHPLPELEPESYLVEGCEELKGDKPPPTPLPLSSPSPPPLPPPTPYGCQPEIRDIVLGILRSGTPLLPESIGHPISASSRLAAASTEITTDNLQALVAQSRRAIVFKIEFPNEISKKSLLVMTTITDDTRTAIISSANSYLDSKSIGL